MNLPKLTDINFVNKKVLVRLDLDVPDDDDSRLELALPTLEYLIKQKSKLVIIGHKGRPKGEMVEKLSLKPVAKRIESLLEKKLGKKALAQVDINVRENLRFSTGEEKNDEHFTSHLAESGDVYINESFGNSHRQHSSIVGLPKLLPHAAGFRFIEEVKTLEKVLKDPKRPVVVIIGGAKEHKLDYVEGLKNFAEKILIGGKLPTFMDEDINDEKLVVARLIQDKEDITVHSIEKFEEEIKKAKTIVLAGPMGKFEEEGHRQGTQKIFKAVAGSSAYKIAGGGDTEAALKVLGLVEDFDWISVGGGSLLEFLSSGTLPGITALVN